MESMAKTSAQRGRRQRQEQRRTTRTWQGKAGYALLRCAAIGILIASGWISRFIACSPSRHHGREQHDDSGQVQAHCRAGHCGTDQHRPKGTELKAQDQCAYRTPQEGNDPQGRAMGTVQSGSQGSPSQRAAEIRAGEMTQSQVDLDKMMRQESIEQDSKMEETPDPLDELITAGTKKDGKEDTAKAIPEEIRRTQADHQLLMQQMGELQQQMMYMVQAFQPPMMGSPMRAGENTPLATPTKVIGTRRHALEPFARQSRREQEGPYVKTPPKPRKVDAQLSTELALDESDIEEVLAPTTKDGYGTADTM